MVERLSSYNKDKNEGFYYFYLLCKVVQAMFKICMRESERVRERDGGREGECVCLVHSWFESSNLIGPHDEVIDFA